MPVDIAEAVPFLRDRHQAALAVVDDDGFPHVSRIVYALGDDGVVRVSITADRVKTGHLRARPRASLHVRGDDDWHWVTVVADAELSDVATTPGDAVVDELLATYEAIAGPHGDAGEFRSAMVEHARLVLRLHPRSVHGML